MGVDIKGIELTLCNGSYRIDYGENFSVNSDGVPFLCFTENNIWQVVSDPERTSGSDAYITLPRGFRPENIKITLRRAGLYSAQLYAGTVELELRESISRFSGITARRIIVSAAKGDVKMKLKPEISADINFGSGSLDVRLDKSSRGYRLQILRGAGTVLLNGRRTGRVHREGSENGVRVNVRCGLGSAAINGEL